MAVHRAAAVDDEAKEATGADSFLTEKGAARGIAEVHVPVIVLADECSMRGCREIVH